MLMDTVLVEVLCIQLAN